MPQVSFNVESEADDWHVSIGSTPDDMQLLLSNPTTDQSEELVPGYYIAQVAIRGTDEMIGKLTISRPRFSDKVVNVSIDPGTGSGINLRSFRVV